MTSPEELSREVIALRRHFHQNPELGCEEYETSAFIKEYLKKCGLEQIESIHGTGVVALLRGAQAGKTLLLRADMDALPVTEETGLSYASQKEGLMHACGHDGHIAMLLTAAKALSENREKLKGNIKFFFQPNEEGCSARECIELGLLKNPTVDAASGLHLWSPIESGKIGISRGAVIAGIECFKITLHGRGGHTGMPEDAIDPVIAAAQVVISAQQIQTRSMDQREPTVLMFGKVQSGTTCNVIPNEAILEGTVRFLYKDEKESLRKFKTRFEQIIQGVCTAYGTSYDIEYSPYRSSPLVNDSGMVEAAKKCAAAIVGQDNLIEYSCMVAEDFSEIAEDVPSVFYFVGARPKAGSQYMHHHPKFDIDEDALLTGVRMHIALAEEFLK